MYFNNSIDGLLADSAPGADADLSQPSHRSLILKSDAINASVMKRGIDIIGAALLLLFLMPAMIAIALAIRLESPGPVLFRQRRYGMGRQTFTMLKFRSMSVLESEGSFRQATAGDSRVTRVGRILRRTSLDELPQLLNVLQGSMSLVGPRPHAIPMDDTYARRVLNYSDRHLVRPGITGLAQIEGFRGPTDGIEKIEMRLRYDRAYIRKWSPAYDVAILLRTPLRLLHTNAL